MIKAAIIQSNYIPWKGYFDLINSVEEFVLYDDVQYTKNDWRNRNRIKTSQGPRWLTIPVRTKNKFGIKIRDIKIADKRWPVKHWKSIKQNYAKSRHFQNLAAWLEELYEKSAAENYLARINFTFIRAIAEFLNISTNITCSADYTLTGGQTEKLVLLCQKLNANVYVSGPAAKNYLRRDQFEKAGISLEFYDYSGYPAYSQLYPPFEHRVSIIDLILNEGIDATQFMLSY